jgi:hypothetical protein
VPNELAGRVAWRFADRPDLPFLYHLAATVEPRWWKLSRTGLHPERVVAAIGGYAAGAIVLLDGEPCGFGGLHGAANTGVATIDLIASSGDEAASALRHVAPDLTAAAFAASPIRRLLHERFSDEPDLLLDMPGMWEHEVTLPEFTKIDGEYLDRLTFAAERERFGAWYASRPAS